MENVSTFYLLPQLKTFDGIIRYDFLKEIEATFDIKNNILVHKNGKEILNHLKCKQVNSILVDNNNVPNTVLMLLLNLM